MATQINKRLFWREIAYPLASWEAETTKESIKANTESGNDCFCIRCIVSVLSKVLSLELLSCPKIWNIEKEKERDQKMRE